MKKKIIPTLSCICLIYFSLLIFISYKQIFPNNFFRALLELFTIPFLILLIVLLGISFKKLHSEKWSIKSKYFFSILILLATLALLIVATILNI
jgi:drug/metabolite transporter (DMT)-like permease